MLVTHLPVCQYPRMSSQSGNNVVSNNSSVNNSNNFNTTNNNNAPAQSSSSAGNVSLVGGSTSAVAAKNQLEQLNTMREALFAQDGWGCQHVNQETNWEVPSSPEPSNKDPTGGPPLWKPNINNGTDLWETNLRNGGQPPTQPTPKTPWGHTPSSNLGGTWGEDDDGADSSNVWSGGSSANAGAPGPVGVPVGVGAGGPVNGPQWGQSPMSVGVGASGVAGNSGALAGVPPGGAAAGSVGPVPVAAGAGSAASAAGNGWGDPRDIRSGPMGGNLDIRNVDPREAMRVASAGDHRDLRLLDPRDPIRGDPRGISGRLNGTSEMWGQHHPIAHSQMSALNKMIGPGGVGASGNVAPAVVPGAGVAAMNPGGVGGINSTSVTGNVGGQWGAAQPVVGAKELSAITGKPVTGWEEPSPPPQRRTIANYDDGTSLWGQQSRVPGGGSHWKEFSDPMNRNHLIRGSLGNQSGSVPSGAPGAAGGVGAGGAAPSQAGGLGTPSVSGNPNNPMGNVLPQGRMPGSITPGVSSQHKPDMWIHQSGTGGGGRNPSSWDDSCHNVGSNWVDDKTSSNISQLGTVGGGNAWTDSNAWNKNQKLPTGSSWGAAGGTDGDMNSEWNAHGGTGIKTQTKLGNLNSELIKQSKQYRILIENGFKKEEVERALNSTNMNLEEAAELLRANASVTLDGWRRHDETLGSYADHPNNATGSGFPGRYTTGNAQASMTFPPNNLLNTVGNPAIGGGGVSNPNLTALNSMQPLQVQKYLGQGGGGGGGPHAGSTGGPQSVGSAVSFSQGANTGVNPGTGSNNPPSTQHLRMLVQQIQLAVRSGYLSSQILNQPLAPTTLLLLNQLLTNINHLQAAQQSLARGQGNHAMINKYKQTIQTLQTQINAQQAIYAKQPPIQQNPQVHPGAAHANAEYLRGQHDAISALQGNFSEMNLNKTSGYHGAPNQQSRLNQWKLPVLEKDMPTDNTDFSRAPGATKQSGNNMGPLTGLQNESTWSTGRNIGDGWPESTNEENKDWSVAQSATAATYTDLVQEFEPGKPWKGSQIKSIEEDPSITPGSVVRSPLSINAATPKEADIFVNASKNSPTDLPPLSLSSSTWSFNPSTSNQNFSNWSDNSQQVASSDMWASSMNKAPRGPPPGLSTNKNAGSNTPGGVVVLNNPSAVNVVPNGWLGGNARSAVPTASGGVGWSGNNSSWNSNWLLLKNLTPQIEASTLRTLCMQHGPLINFHMYLQQGLALCKYATREEANKAQMTLNNCVLGNTTICAESPSENEVQNILQHLPQSTVNPTGVGNNSSGSTGGSNTNSSGNGCGSVGVNSNNGNSNPNTNSNIALNGATAGGNGVANGSSLVAGNGVSSGATNTQIQPNSSVAIGNTGGGNGNNGNPGSNNSNSQQANPSVGATSVGGGGSGGGANGGNNSSNAWRQNQPNQARPTGRETDFDYISKYVCSIVDDEN